MKRHDCSRLLPVLTSTLISILLSIPIEVHAYQFKYESVHLGALHLGMTAATLKESSTCSFTTGKMELWEADGLYHQKWRSTKCGISLDMQSDKKKSIQTIGAIIVTAPSTVATDLGIHIGSSENDTTAAYRSAINHEESIEHENLIVGSVYGGLSFMFKKGKVTQIFLGAAAE